MGDRLRKVSIQGFKSIESLNNFPLDRLTVMIGANGAGKSNFVDFFRLLHAMANESLQPFVQQRGGGDGFFYLGPKHTRQISAHLCFGENVYEFDLAPAADGKLFISDERIQFTGGQGWGRLRSIGKGNTESQLKARRDDSAVMSEGTGVAHYVNEVIPYVQAHEFESILLADVDRLASVLDISTPAIARLKEVIAEAGAPEAVNDDPEKIPSRRISDLRAGYRKPIHGIIAAQRIGLSAMRASCSNFNSWLERLDGIGRQSCRVSLVHRGR